MIFTSQTGNEYQVEEEDSSRDELEVEDGKIRIRDFLGLGRFGQVVGATTSDGEDVAIKVLNKRHVKKAKVDVQKEIDIMKLLKHKHIIRLYDVIHDSINIYLVLELAPSGDLWDKVTQNVFDERTAHYFWHQLIQGLDYCHQRGVIHRDLKLENLLLDDKDTLKICDFGLSEQVHEGTMLTGTSGSKHYTAPEVWRALYGQSYRGAPTDVWSCGVILFAMVFGCYPFEVSTTLADCYEYRMLLQNGEYPYPSDVDDFSTGLKDMLDCIFVTDPQRRATIADIKSHPWFRGETAPHRDSHLLGMMADEREAYADNDEFANFNTIVSADTIGSSREQSMADHRARSSSDTRRHSGDEASDYDDEDVDTEPLEGQDTEGSHLGTAGFSGEFEGAGDSFFTDDGLSLDVQDRDDAGSLYFAGNSEENEADDRMRSTQHTQQHTQRGHGRRSNTRAGAAQQSDSMMSVSTISSMVSEDEDALRDFSEPYLRDDDEDDITYREASYGPADDDEFDVDESSFAPNSEFFRSAYRYDFIEDGFGIDDEPMFRGLSSELASTLTLDNVEAEDAEGLDKLPEFRASKVRRCTRFVAANVPLDTLMSDIQSALQSMKSEYQLGDIHVDDERYAFQAQTQEEDEQDEQDKQSESTEDNDSQQPQLGLLGMEDESTFEFDVLLYKYATGKPLVEVRRRQGTILRFQKFYKAFTAQLGDLVVSEDVNV